MGGQGVGGLSTLVVLTHYVRKVSVAPRSIHCGLFCVLMSLSSFLCCLDSVAPLSALPCACSSAALTEMQTSIPPHARKWRHLTEACDHVGAVMLMLTALEACMWMSLGRGQGRHKSRGGRSGMENCYLEEDHPEIISTNQGK